LKSRLMGVSPGAHLPFDFAQGKRGRKVGQRWPTARRSRRGGTPFRPEFMQRLMTLVALSLR
jgi:hypothetical protein